jgi:hypothetical protein
MLEMTQNTRTRKAYSVNNSFRLQAVLNSKEMLRMICITGDFY